MDTANDAHKYTLKQLARIRRGCLEILDTPLFLRQEIPATVVHGAASEGRELGYQCIFARKHGSHVQYYRIPDREKEVFDSMQMILALIDRLARKIVHERKSFAQDIQCADEMGHDLLAVGMHAAALGIVIDHKNRSRPKNSVKAKLTDTENRKFAEDEIRRQLRPGSKVSFTAACDRTAAILLRDREIHISGRTLRNIFTSLKPTNLR